MRNTCLVILVLTAVWSGAHAQTPGTVVLPSWVTPWLDTTGWKTTHGNVDNYYEDVAVVTEVTMPTNANADGLIFEAGCTGWGAFIGIKSGKLRAQFGEGGTSVVSDANSVVLEVALPHPGIPLDGNRHEIATKFLRSTGKLDLFVDGVFIQSASTTTGSGFSEGWQGGNTATFGAQSSCIPNGAINDEWPVGTSGRLRLFILNAQMTPAPLTPAPPTLMPDTTCDGACLNFRCAGGALLTDPNGYATLLLEGTVEAQSGVVWGTSYYTSDSHVAAAALHAGVLAVGETKRVRVRCAGERTAFAGTAQHNVVTTAYAPAWQSFYFVDDATVVVANSAEVVETCYHWFCAMSKCFTKGQVFDLVVTGQVSTTERAVWGDVIYTEDSDIRAAAVHTGLLQDGETATLTVMCYGAQENYAAAARHGVISEAWGAWGNSWALKIAPPVSTTAGCPLVAFDLKEGGTMDLNGWRRGPPGYSPRVASGSSVRRAAFQDSVWSENGGNCLDWCSRDPNTFAVATWYNQPSHSCWCYSTDLSHAIYSRAALQFPDGVPMVALGVAGDAPTLIPYYRCELGELPVNG